MFKYVFSLFTASVLSLLLVGCSSEKNKSKPIIFGTDASYFPYEYRDDQGNLIGLDMDLAAEIAKRLKRPLVIRVMEFDVLFEAVDDKTIDIAIDSISVTPVRQANYAMLPYAPGEAHFYVLGFWNRIPDNIRSLEDVKKGNLKLGVQGRSEQADYLTTIPGINVIPKPSEDQVVNDLRFQRIDAALWEPEAAMYIKMHYPEVKLIKIPMPKERWVDYYGLVLNKKNQELIQQVTKIIEDLKKDETIKNLEDKWLSKEKPEAFLENQ